jgi:undecaprenyl pyrophosphate phosphatase UppP
LSRVGVLTSVSSIRGADKEHSLNWALMLSFPVLLVLLGFDVYAIITEGVGNVGLMAALNYALATFGAFFGASICLRMLRSFSKRVGFSGFAYYCWGAALFTFIMYLAV